MGQRECLARPCLPVPQQEACGCVERGWALCVACVQAECRSRGAQQRVQGRVCAHACEHPQCVCAQQRACVRCSHGDAACERSALEHEHARERHRQRQTHRRTREACEGTCISASAETEKTQQHLQDHTHQRCIPRGERARVCTQHRHNRFVYDALHVRGALLRVKNPYFMLVCIIPVLKKLLLRMHDADLWI